MKMGGVGTTSKNCMHECALPEGYDGDLELAADGKTLLTVGGVNSGEALGALPQLLALSASSSPAVRLQAVWALANLAVDAEVTP